MSSLELPLFAFGLLLLGASPLGCGGAAAGAPSPDGSVVDAADDRTQSAAEASTGPGEEDALEEAPPADGCAGVRCAAPPPCDRPCTTPCCCDRSSCPAADGGIDSGAPSADAGSGDDAACANAGDCRLFSDMCGGCACLALSANAADPVCPGPTGECLVDPCSGRSPVCSGGHCIAHMP